MSTSIHSESHRIKSLDGLRGIAILLVLFLHFFGHGFLKPLFSYGGIGVDLFFVLSGFLITRILLRTKDKKGYYKTFIVRRALRTLPLYYTVLIIFALISPYFEPIKWFGQDQGYFWTHTSNILFLQEGFAFKPLGHFWSLALEEQFYFIWPLFVYLLTPKQLIGFSVLLLIAGIIIRTIYPHPIVAYGFPLAHLDGILIGSIIAVMPVIQKISYRNTTILFCLCGVLCVVGKLLPGPLTITLVSLFFGSALILALKPGVFASALSNKTLIFFGKYSYGMYVFNSLIFHFSNWVGVGQQPENTRLIFYAAGFVLTIVISYLSYHLLEAKFLGLKESVGRPAVVPTHKTI